MRTRKLSNLVSQQTLKMNTGKRKELKTLDSTWKKKIEPQETVNTSQS
jgi:hypothetical protein